MRLHVSLPLLTDGVLMGLNDAEKHGGEYRN